MLLKSKANKKVEELGLIADRVCYELLAIETTQEEKLIIVLRTGFENCWTGQQSIIDKELQITPKIKELFRLK